MLAGSGRLATELVRTNPAFLGPLTGAQTVAIVGVALGGWLWVNARRPGAAARPT